MMKIAKWMLVGFFGLIAISIFSVASGSNNTVTSNNVEKVVKTTTQNIWDTQASSMAQQYLEVMPFSREGLIDQLVVGSGFSNQEATKAVDSLNVNWNEQAVLAAQQYLEVMPFSRSGLIDQLVIGSQFTTSQANYALSVVG